MPYYYLASQPDQAGTGMTMYEIWYGENDQLSNSTPSQYADAKKAWLAVPAGSAVPVHSYVVSLKPTTENATIGIYGRPTTSSSYIIGIAPIRLAVGRSEVGVRGRHAEPVVRHRLQPPGGVGAELGGDGRRLVLIRCWFRC